jgi:hypothetical protein
VPGPARPFSSQACASAAFDGVVELEAKFPARHDRGPRAELNSPSPDQGAKPDAGAPDGPNDDGPASSED